MKFVVGSESFAWHFDTVRDSDRFLLSEIAPKEVRMSKVRVYVSPNPLYHGG